MEGWSPKCQVCGEEFDKRNLMAMINHWRAHKRDGTAPKLENKKEICHEIIKRARERNKSASSAETIAPFLRNLVSNGPETEESKKNEIDAYNKVMAIVRNVKSKPGYKSPVLDLDTIFKNSNSEENSISAIDVTLPSGATNGGISSAPSGGFLECKICGMAFHSFFKARDHHQMHKREVIEEGVAGIDINGDNNDSKSEDIPESRDVSSFGDSNAQIEFAGTHKQSNDTQYASSQAASENFKMEYADSITDLKQAEEEIPCVIIDDTDSDSDSLDLAHPTPLAYDFDEFKKAAEESKKKRLSGDSSSANSVSSKVSPPSGKTNISLITTPDGSSSKSTLFLSEPLSSSPVGTYSLSEQMDISSNTSETSIEIVSVTSLANCSKPILTDQDTDTAMESMNPTGKKGITTSTESGSDFSSQQKSAKKKQSRKLSKVISSVTETDDTDTATECLNPTGKKGRLIITTSTESGSDFPSQQKSSKKKQSRKLSKVISSVTETDDTATESLNPTGKKGRLIITTSTESASDIPLQQKSANKKQTKKLSKVISLVSETEDTDTAIATESLIPTDKKGRLITTTSTDSASDDFQSEQKSTKKKQTKNLSKVISSVTETEDTDTAIATEFLNPTGKKGRLIKTTSTESASDFPSQQKLAKKKQTRKLSKGISSDTEIEDSFPFQLNNTGQSSILSTGTDSGTLEAPIFKPISRESLKNSRKKKKKLISKPISGGSLKKSKKKKKVISAKEKKKISCRLIHSEIVVKRKKKKVKTARKIMDSDTNSEEDKKSTSQKKIIETSSGSEKIKKSVWTDIINSPSKKMNPSVKIDNYDRVFDVTDTEEESSDSSSESDDGEPLAESVVTEPQELESQEMQIEAADMSFDELQGDAMDLDSEENVTDTENDLIPDSEDSQRLFIDTQVFPDSCPEQQLSTSLLPNSDMMEDAQNCDQGNVELQPPKIADVEEFSEESLELEDDKNPNLLPTQEKANGETVPVTLALGDKATLSECPDTLSKNMADISGTQEEKYYETLRKMYEDISDEETADSEKQNDPNQANQIGESNDAEQIREISHVQPAVNNSNSVLVPTQSIPVPNLATVNHVPLAQAYQQPVIGSTGINPGGTSYIFGNSTIGNLYPSPLMQNYEINPHVSNYPSGMVNHVSPVSQIINHSFSPSAQPQEVQDENVVQTTKPTLMYEDLSDEDTFVTKQSGSNNSIVTEQLQKDISQNERSFDSGPLIIDSQPARDCNISISEAQSKCIVSPDLTVFPEYDESTPERNILNKKNSLNREENGNSGEFEMSDDDISECIIKKPRKKQIKKEYRPMKTDKKDIGELNMMDAGKRRQKITPRRRMTAENTIPDRNIFEIIEEDSNSPNTRDSTEIASLMSEAQESLLRQQSAALNLSNKIVEATPSENIEIDLSPLDLSASKMSSTLPKKSSVPSNDSSCDSSLRKMSPDLCKVTVSGDQNTKQMSSLEDTVTKQASMSSPVQNRSLKHHELTISTSRNDNISSSAGIDLQSNENNMDTSDVGIPNEPIVVKRRSTARKSIRRMSSHQEQPSLLALLSSPETIQPIKTISCDFCGKSVSSLQKDLYLHWQNDCKTGQL